MENNWRIRNRLIFNQQSGYSYNLEYGTGRDGLVSVLNWYAALIQEERKRYDKMASEVEKLRARAQTAEANGYRLLDAYGEAYKTEIRRLHNSIVDLQNQLREFNANLVTAEDRESMDAPSPSPLREGNIPTISIHKIEDNALVYLGDWVPVNAKGTFSINEVIWFKGDCWRVVRVLEDKLIKNMFSLHVISAHL